MTIAQLLVFPVLGLFVVDVRQTMIALPRGHEELNPVVALFVEKLGPDLGLAIGVGLVLKSVSGSGWSSMTFVPLMAWP